MNVIEFPKTVHIVEADPVWAQSLKFMLETHSQRVKTYDDSREFECSQCSDQDIVLIDLDGGRPSVFNLVNQLLYAASRPNIVLTSALKSIFKPDDVFPGGRITVLSKPFSPKDLLQRLDLSPA